MRNSDRRLESNERERLCISEANAMMLPFSMIPVESANVDCKKSNGWERETSIVAIGGGKTEQIRPAVKACMHGK